MKKKFLTAFLSLILVLNMAACSPSPKKDSDGRDFSESTASEPLESASSPSGSAAFDALIPAPSTPAPAISDSSVLTPSDSDASYPAVSDTPSEKEGTVKYASLEEWLSSEEKEEIVTQANEQLNSLGISIDFLAEGNILVMEYSFAKQQKVDASQKKTEESFAQRVAPVFVDSAASLYESFESEYGLTLENIRVVVRNADGEELYSKYHSEP